MITERCARPLDSVHQTDQVIHPAVSPTREENTKRKKRKKGKQYEELLEKPPGSNTKQSY
jgi:hypothetical protein